MYGVIPNLFRDMTYGETLKSPPYRSGRKFRMTESATDCNNSPKSLLELQKFKAMFTVEQIEQAHQKVKSGADFPKYIQEIKLLGVTGFETWVKDSHTEYFGTNNYQTQSKPQYEELTIAEKSNNQKFVDYLKKHQRGETNYFTFCQHCAETGIEKWIVNLEKMTCTYFDKTGNEILVEQIPQ